MDNRIHSGVEIKTMLQFHNWRSIKFGAKGRLILPELVQYCLYFNRNEQSSKHKKTAKSSQYLIFHHFYVSWFVF